MPSTTRLDMVQCKWIILKLVEISCNVAFIATVVIFAYQYSEKLTTTLTEVEERQNLIWPSLTFCVTQGYKNPGFHYKEPDFLANTFSKEDIFAQKTLEKLENTSRYRVIEVRSHTHGRCYSVHQLNSAKVLSWDDSTFYLKRDNDLVLLVSYPGDEFFTLRFIFPVPADILDLPIKSQTQMKFADLHLDLEEILFLSKNRRCHHYSGMFQTYESCIRSKIIEFKRTNYSCLTAYDKTLPKDKSEFIDCDNETEQDAKNNHLHTSQVSGIIFANSSGYGCPKSCKIVAFNANINFFHKYTNPIKYQDMDTFTLMMYYDTSDVKKYSEHLVFDEMALLSAIGGTLGLLLGYSVLSIMTSIINQCHEFFQNCMQSQ